MGGGRHTRKKNYSSAPMKMSKNNFCFKKLYVCTTESRVYEKKTKIFNSEQVGQGKCEIDKGNGRYYFLNGLGIFLKIWKYVVGRLVTNYCRQNFETTINIKVQSE